VAAVSELCGATCSRGTGSLVQSLLYMLCAVDALEAFSSAEKEFLGLQ
jgi:hypothetical protein